MRVKGLAGSSCDASGSSSGRPVAGSASGEVLELPFVHAGQPIAERGRWAEPRVAENIGVTQGLQIRPVPADPCVDLISSADGPVAGDDDIDVARRALEQAQRGQVVLDRVSGAVQVEQRNQDVGQHVGGDEDPALLDQQRRMARSMCLMLDDADLRAIPGNPCYWGFGAGGLAAIAQLAGLGETRVDGTVVVDGHPRIMATLTRAKTLVD